MNDSFLHLQNNSKILIYCYFIIISVLLQHRKKETPEKPNNRNIYIFSDIPSSME